MIITSKTIEWKEKIPTGLIKGWVVKRQRAFVTPFRDAAALEVVPVHLVLTLFTRKKQYDLGTSYTHKKRKQYKHG